METLFLKVLGMSITATYVILAVLLIRLLLKRAPKKYSYLLWAVVLFRLVCPVSFSSELSIFNANPFDMTAAQKSSDMALNYVPADVGYMESPKVMVGIPTLNTIINDKLPAVEPVASVNPLQIWIWLGSIIWCLGFAVLLIYSMVVLIRLRRRMATAVRLNDNIYESDQIRSPFVLGFIKPRIYIPFGLGEQERKYILRHEAYHLKRKDHLIKPIAFLVLAFHWFNPFVWLAFVSMGKDMEMSCDEKVLSEIGTVNRKEYCTSLLSFAANRRFPSAGPLAFGETSVRERMMNILRFKAPRKWVVALSAVACIAVVAACGTNPIAKEAPKNEAGELYGSYSFEKKVYMNPLSSLFVSEGYKEYYTFTGDSLIITDGDGNQQKIAIDYERTTVDEQEFKKGFMIENIGVPDIASYTERYQYVLKSPSASPAYRLYLLDGEIWLAKIHKDTANIQKSEYFWSIFKINKLDGKIPLKATIVGFQDNVDAFLALQKNFESGYDTDTVYNITPEYIKANSEYMIFKYDTSAASYLLYEGEVYPLGEWFGGFGVTSMALADLDGDGRSELFFTYSWGSGLHRSHAAYFSPAAKQIVPLEYTHMNGDMLLTDNYDGSLSLFAAAITSLGGFVNFEIEGTDFITDIVYADGHVSLNPAAKEQHGL